MTLPSSNPDAAEIFNWRYARAVRDFAAGGSEAVFKASLFALGYRGARLDDEVTFQYTSGVRKVKVVDSYKGGLPARGW